MPIYKLLQDAAFDPERCHAMGIAYEALLRELGLTNRRGDPLCEIVAKRVIELGNSGVSDPQRLHDETLAAIRP